MGIDEYYKHYLTLHQNKACRALHFLGQCVTIGCIAGIILHGAWLMLLGVPFIVYPFAWAGHYFFEKNSPAAFSDPVKAKISDWLMFRDIILGRIKIW